MEKVGVICLFVEVLSCSFLKVTVFPWCVVLLYLAGIPFRLWPHECVSHSDRSGMVSILTSLVLLHKVWLYMHITGHIYQYVESCLKIKGDYTLDDLKGNSPNHDDIVHLCHTGIIQIWDVVQPITSNTTL